MGCTASKPEDSDVVTCCKQRMRSMKHAVCYREEFALNHALYIASLKSIGEALRLFATRENYPSISTTFMPASKLSPPLPKVVESTTPSPPFSTSSASSPLPTTSPHSPRFPPIESTSIESTSRTLHPPPPPPPLHPLSRHVFAPPPPPPPPPPRPLPPSSVSISRRVFHAPPPPPTLAPDFSPPLREMSRSISMPPIHTNLQMMSPERSPDDFFSPGRSPSFSVVTAKDENYEEFTPNSSSPPPLISVITPSLSLDSHNTMWNFSHIDQFDPSIPPHLQELRRLKQAGIEEQRRKDMQLAISKEGIPDLEEEEAPVIEEDIKIHKEKAEIPIEGIPESKETLTNNGFVTKLSLEESEPESEMDLNEALEVEDDVAERESVLNVDEYEEITEEERRREKKEEENREETKEDNERNKQITVLDTCEGKNLKEVVELICKEFSRACVGSKDVSGMLETHKIHHHSSVLESRESFKVFNVVASYRSSKTLAILKDLEEETDMVECGMAGSHASTLERLYAWEKKLYDEVKDGEEIRRDFDRKRKQLRMEDAKGKDRQKADKIRASVKDLDSRLKVALHSIRSISVTIQNLTQDELYPQLAEIVGGLTTMWRVMLECYTSQKQIASEMTSLDESSAGDVATDTHWRATMELEAQINNWHKVHNQWIKAQLFYIQSLLEWLESCQLPPEMDRRGKQLTLHSQDLPVCNLVSKWMNSLNGLRKESVDSVLEFSRALHSLQALQAKELQQKRKADGFSKDLIRKTQSLQKSESRHREDFDVFAQSTTTLHGKRAALSELQIRIEEEEEKHSGVFQERKNATLQSFKTHLPSVFNSLSTFASAALTQYETLQLESENGQL